MNILDMTGRRVLVTGAGQGVGRQVALHCAAHGAAVVVNDFHADRAKTVAGEITDDGGEAVGVSCDVTDLDAVSAMVGQNGPVDVLVNNAGNAGPAEDPLAHTPPFWETGPQDWEPWIGTNLYGVLNASRAVLPGMVERGYGRIVTVISDAGRTGEPNLAVYGGAKAGAAGFSRGLAKSVGRHGITVNCVALSTVATPGIAPAIADPEIARKMLRGYPLRRFGEPSDAANAVLFLASDAASWVTGQTYPVNGGYAITP
ncbi:SDR family NAD(P)-dependent oxidoreductase [Pseudonocardia endophytica]|uniref:3-oxoacyl-[acyl-carrier protein] reductase n=1 Tax=Pseudonocardia endophytica TaxID=401976 RepID=A0A4R1IAX7_PSEEN|nr:SDR family NAD(P)-dependent oxidoreductase [Pseudonocardia endophytica]TCK27542.1 3-oxoacyl-[acyl-carrier protein] reductase [Pseudonocardia endophytica]